MADRQRIHPYRFRDLIHFDELQYEDLDLYLAVRMGAIRRDGQLDLLSGGPYPAPAPAPADIAVFPAEATIVEENLQQAELEEASLVANVTEVAEVTKVTKVAEAESMLIQTTESTINPLFTEVTEVTKVAEAEAESMLIQTTE